MHLKLESHILKQGLIQSGDRLVLAISGGKDSMCLLHIMQQLPVDLIVAHCNFQLRGEESDGDEAFIRSYCQNKGLTFKSVRFDTEKLSKAKKLSIQEIARALRYDWLEEIRVEEHAQGIVTAHHLQDNIETLIFNLTKGTGMRGLRGMQVRNGYILRPLLGVSQEDILAYIEKNAVPYREDSSNQKLDYDRNKIRQEVLPVLRAINPNLDNTLLNHFLRWNGISAMYEGALAYWQKQLFEHRSGGIYISIKKLKNYSFADNLLFELLAPFGFNSSTVQDIIHSLEDAALKEFEGNGFLLLKDRKFLIIIDERHLDENQMFSIKLNDRKIKLPFNESLAIQRKPIAKLSKMNKSSDWSYLDKDKLEFPLFLRKWKEGDYFYPFGLVKASGKVGKKKIGKFLRDEKVDALKRKNTYVVVSGQHIVCLIGHRIDARFAVDSKTKEVLILHKK